MITFFIGLKKYKNIIPDKILSVNYEWKKKIGCFFNYTVDIFLRIKIMLEVQVSF